MTDELTDELDRLGVAHHEVAHAVSARLAGLRVSSLHIDVSGWNGEVLGGHAMIDVPNKDAPVALVDGFAVMLFAGLTAQLKFLDAAGVLDGRLQSRLEERTADGEDSDYGRWLKVRRSCSVTESQARARAVSLVDAHWPRITRRAELLRTRTTVAGSAV